VFRRSPHLLHCALVTSCICKPADFDFICNLLLSLTRLPPRARPPCFPCTQPLLPGVFRKALKDFEVGGYSIRAGTSISLNMFAVSELDPAWADLPADSPFAISKFNPDRWA
jgi:hypothetical protein